MSSKLKGLDQSLENNHDRKRQTKGISWKKSAKLLAPIKFLNDKINDHKVKYTGHKHHLGNSLGPNRVLDHGASNRC